jgi:Flp pilus assembly protein TadG
MNMMPISSIWLRLRRCAAEMLADRSGIAATEFAVIVPIMLVMFFGTVEFSSGVAVSRKVTLVARTLSDLTSQTMNAVTDTDVKNFFSASASILTPYVVTPTDPTLSEIYVDANKIAKIQWSKSATIAMVSGAPQATLKNSARSKGDVVTGTVPAALLVADTYLIFSEVTYKYTPAVGYVMAKAGVTLKDVSYTRPRQSKCVDYPAAVAPAVACTPA